MANNTKYSNYGLVNITKYGGKETKTRGHVIKYKGASAILVAAHLPILILFPLKMNNDQLMNHVFIYIYMFYIDFITLALI